MVSDTAGARGDLMGQFLSNPHRNTKYGLAEHLLKKQFLQSKLKSKSSKWVRDEYYEVYIKTFYNNKLGLSCAKLRIVELKIEDR